MKHLTDNLVRQVQNQLKTVQEKSEQVHVALLALTETESFDIGLGAAPSGLEALRRLVRRWDPLSGGKHRALLRHILVADRCKLQRLRIQDSCNKEHLRSDGGGQLCQKKQERQEGENDVKNGKKEGEHHDHNPAI